MYWYWYQSVYWSGFINSVAMNWYFPHFYRQKWLRLFAICFSRKIRDMRISTWKSSLPLLFAKPKSSRKFVQAIRTHKNSSLGLIAVCRQKILTHGGPGFQFGRMVGTLAIWISSTEDLQWCQCKRVCPEKLKYFDKNAYDTIRDGVGVGVEFNAPLDTV